MHTNGSMPLSMVSAGETVELVKIRGGQRLRKRLADLGLNIGMTVQVVQNAHTGPMILAIKRDARLAIGRGMAHKIRVALPDDQTQQKGITQRGVTHGSKLHRRPCR